MSNPPLSSRERMLAALECREPDYVPCCFFGFDILRERCADHFDYVSKQLEMGLDATVSHNLALCHDPRVRIKEWREDRPGEPCPILHKEYVTPGGTLHAAVNKTDDWPHGDHIPLVTDYLIPRSRKFLVTRRDDLNALRYVLGPPADEAVRGSRRRAREARAWAAERGVLVAGGFGMVGDLACWLTGMQELVLLAVDEWDFVRELFELIADWNRRQMGAILDEGVDLFIRRGWYESADLWSPKLFRDLILPSLRSDAELAHQAGAKFGYIMTSGCMALLDMIMDAGVDVMIGVDPVQGKGTDLGALKQRTAGRMCLWGGVNSYVTLERGTPEDVQAQVRETITTLGPGGGLILSPIDNVKEDNEDVWGNVRTMLETWRSLRDYPVSRVEG